MAEGIIVRRGGGSAGAGLNFKVVGGTTKPSSPVENTIWFNTSNAITCWTFSPSEPSTPIEGMVWINTGGIDRYAFNALKKNELYVQPSSVQHYINSAWHPAEDAQIYQGAQWHEFFSGYLFDNGVLEAAYDAGIYVSPSTCTVTFSENQFSCVTTASKTSEAYAVFGQVNLAAYNKIIATGVFPTSNPDNSAVNAVLYIAKELNKGVASAVAVAVTTIKPTQAEAPFTVELDVSGQGNEMYYIYCGTHTDGSSWSNKRTANYYTLKLE